MIHFLCIITVIIYRKVECFENVFYPFFFLIAGATSEGVLANFFNSLLSKKTGSPGGPGVGAGSPGGGAAGGGGGLPPSAKKSGTYWRFPSLPAVLCIASVHFSVLMYLQTYTNHFVVVI